MEFKKSLIAVAVLSTALVGCGGSSSSSSKDDDPIVDPVAGLPSFVECNEAGDTCIISGNVDEDFTLTDDVNWVLDGFVTVGNGNAELTSQAAVDAVKANGVTLTVEAGVHVKALNTGALLVTRGSKLMAEGTAAAPITFSSSDDNFDGLGEWGGVIIQGFAPQYGQGGTGACYTGGAICNVKGEGGADVAMFGGNDPADNSGVIKYVRIAEAGKSVGVDNEINGLTLQGVGHATVVDYVQVHNNLDDGVEWFGGTVNATHLVLTGNDDDDIDFDEGYKGNIQFAIIRKDPDATGPQGTNDPRGIEANSSDNKYVPETAGALANILIIGSEVNKAVNSEGDGLQPGMRLRGSLTTRIYNSAVLNFDDCVRIDDSNTDGKTDTTGAGMPAGIDSLSDVTLVNVIGACDDKFYAKRIADTETGTIGMESSITVDAAVAITDAAADNLSAVTFEPVDNGSGFAFTATDYVGAVEPGTAAASAWWAGWTIPGSLDGVAVTQTGNVPAP